MNMSMMNVCTLKHTGVIAPTCHRHSVSLKALAPRKNNADGFVGRYSRNGYESHVVCRASMMGAVVDTRLSLDELKSLLEDTLWGTNRGLSANSDTRAEITDLVTQLEALNPTPEPNEAGEKLSGKWRLVYTTNSELVPLLALGNLPLLEVGEISQTIMGETGQVENKVEFMVPFSKTSIGSKASFDVRSPKLLEIKFTDGTIFTPELMSDFELPDSIEIAGQMVDLSPLKTALQPLDGPVRSAISQAGAFLAGQPDLTFNTPTQKPTWLLNTYLDDELRIARGDGGSLFIMKKEPLLSLPEKIENDEVPVVQPIVDDMEQQESTGNSATLPVVVAEEAQEDALSKKDAEEGPADDVAL